MQIKKNPKVRLENYSKIFSLVGLVLALFITYQLLEVKSYENSLRDSLGDANMVLDDKDDIPIIERKELTIPKDTPPPPVAAKIEIVEDNLDIEETIIDDTETDENEAVRIIVDPNSIVEEYEEEEIEEDVPFLIIEDVPVFPGCSGNKEELKKCFTKKIKMFFIKEFDVGLAKELGLSMGKKRIIVQFKIDKTGMVTNVMARAPHPRIQSDVISIIKKLPKMKPGRQRGMPVGVKYSLPITFEIL
tara:strand:+ start:12156 stop:12893 length:738 start_codon:yes stop_codon:yes gene_type:complete